MINRYEDMKMGDAEVFAAIVGVCVVVVALVLGVVKVRNELDMTKAYDRQAAALERIADTSDITVQLKDKRQRIVVSYGRKLPKCVDSGMHLGVPVQATDEELGCQQKIGWVRVLPQEESCWRRTDGTEPIVCMWR